MQIIEVTDFGVRSAVIELHRPGTPLRFVLYPMIHMARPAFYAAVTSRLRRADLVVVEGVGGGPGRRSVLLNALTMSYRVLRFNPRTRLVEQDIDYAGLGVPLIRPDVTVAEFEAGWRRVPLRYRLAMWVALPAVILVRLVGGTRMIWTRSVEQYDLPTAEEEEWANHPSGLSEVFLGERDDRLIAVLADLSARRSAEDLTVAVVYGAGHIPAVVQGMRTRCGYHPRAAEWLLLADR